MGAMLTTGTAWLAVSFSCLTTTYEEDVEDDEDITHHRPAAFGAAQ